MGSWAGKTFAAIVMICTLGVPAAAFGATGEAGASTLEAANMQEAGAHAESLSPQATGEPSAKKAMYRLYNQYSGEHFYTADSEERDSLVSIGWNYEGIGWFAPATSEAPVYRLYNAYGGEHHYTMKAGERDGLIAAGWTDEGVGWCSDDAETVPLYREYNPNESANNHNYTTGKDEHDNLVSLGWTDEGCAWYAVEQGQMILHEMDGVIWVRDEAIKSSSVVDRGPGWITIAWEPNEDALYDYTGYKVEVVEKEYLPNGRWREGNAWVRSTSETSITADIPDMAGCDVAIWIHAKGEIGGKPLMVANGWISSAIPSS